MPRVRITELLHEVARRTGFAHAFTDLRSGKPVDNENALLAAILADGTISVWNGWPMHRRA